MKNLIIDIVREAAKIAISYQNKMNIKTKEDSTIVTDGDIAVSNFLINKLSQFYPVLSEENYDISLLKQGNTFFVIDPIDGTQSYSKKEDSWVIIVTLVIDNNPVEAWIYQPLLDKFFYAKKNEGAILITKNNEMPLKVKKGDKLTCSPNYKDEDLKLVKYYSSIDFQYGAALKILSIAEGKYHIYPIKNRWFGIWDLIGAYLILMEAGGKFTFLDNYKFDLNQQKINTPFIVLSN